MNKLKYIIIVLLTLQGVIMSSCSDWLDLEPTDGVPGSKYWKTKEDVKSAITGAYLSMTESGLTQRLFLYGEWRADMVQLRSGASAADEIADVTSVFDGEISVENSFLDWASFYKTINLCNTILKYAPEAQANDNSFSEDLLDEYVAEATAIRSLMYFYLVRSFGDVPFVLEAYTSTAQNMNVRKMDKDEILQFLVSHLIEAEKSIPLKYSTTDTAKNKGKMTLWAVKALLADIYLWKEEYQNCLNKCNEIINSGQFTLIPVLREETTVEDEGGVEHTVYHPNMNSYYSLFRDMYFNGNSVESIFEIQFSTDGPNPFYNWFRSAGKFAAKTDVLASDIFIPTNFNDGEYYDIRNVISQNKGTLWKYAGIEVNGSERAKAEYTGNFIIYRLAEIYLMKAEALTQLAIQAEDDQDKLEEARNVLEKIRIRGNAVETTDLTWEQTVYDGKTMERFVLEERAREMAFEGKRWFDVLRQAKRGNYAGDNLDYLLNLALTSAPPEKISSLQTKYRDYSSHYLPIFIDELDANPLLEQNNFYEK